MSTDLPIEEQRKPLFEDVPLLNYLLLPFTLFFLAIVLGFSQDKIDKPTVVAVGLTIDIIGALLLALPDLAVRQYLTTPNKLREVRNQLFQVGHATRNGYSTELFEVIEKVIESYWAGDLRDQPQEVYVKRVFPPGQGRSSEKGILVQYKSAEEAETPIERTQKMDPEEYSLEEAVFGGEDYDWVAQQTLFYQWLGEEIERLERHLTWIRTQGGIVLMGGFTLQLIASL
jgi:hypothetical protein